MKKNCKSLIASVLAVAMIFALAACGSPAGTPSGSPAAPGKPGKTGSESTPAFVYVSSFREVKNENNRGIGTTCFTDKGLYTTPSEIVGHRDLPGVTKACPSFDVRKWLREIGIR